jgi:hypothetical protein
VEEHMNPMSLKHLMSKKISRAVMYWNLFAQSRKNRRKVLFSATSIISEEKLAGFFILSIILCIALNVMFMIALDYLLIIKIIGVT